jgi:hypothetical protein
MLLARDAWTVLRAEPARRAAMDRAAMCLKVLDLWLRGD